MHETILVRFDSEQHHLNCLATGLSFEKLRLNKPVVPGHYVMSNLLKLSALGHLCTSCVYRHVSYLGLNGASMKSRH